MKVLVHYKIQQYKDFTTKIVALNERYITNDFNLQKDVETTLNELQEFLKEIGESTHESTVSQLRMYLKTAVSGINPMSLEKVKIGRRNLITSAIYHCLSQVLELLDHTITTTQHTIDGVTETLKQVILSVLQSNAITLEELKSTDTIEKIEQLWGQLILNEQINLIHQKVSLEVVKQDIYIILDKQIHKLQSN